MSLKGYLLSRAKLRKWEFHPLMKSSHSEVEKAEESMKQAIFEKVSARRFLIKLAYK